jgi:hypothetical protein
MADLGMVLSVEADVFGIYVYAEFLHQARTHNYG